MYSIVWYAAAIHEEFDLRLENVELQLPPENDRSPASRGYEYRSRTHSHPTGGDGYDGGAVLPGLFYDGCRMD